MGGLRISGAVSGIDTESLISDLIKLERRPVNLLEAKRAALMRRQPAWQSLLNQMRNLQDRVEALRGATLWNRTAVHSSNQTVLSVSGTYATAGVYHIEVSALATTHTVSSATQASPDQALGLEGSPLLGSQAIEVTAEDTLSTLASKINTDDGTGARAAVIRVSDGDYRLVLTSRSTGTAGALDFVDDGGIWTALGVIDGEGLANTIQLAQDASFAINGLAVTRSSNTITDVVAGLTLNLAATGTASATVSPDSEAVLGAAREFVNAYNSLHSFAKAELTAPGGDASRPPLYGESALRLMQSRLRGLAMDPVPDLPDESRMLWQIGISTGLAGSEVGRDGQLHLDESLLLSKLESSPEAVRDLLGVGTTGGVLGRLDEYMQGFTRNSSGLVAMRSQSLDRQMRSLTQAIDDAMLRLELRETRLRRQFTAMEQALSSMQTQSTWLGQQLTTASSMWQQPKR